MNVMSDPAPTPTLLFVDGDAAYMSVVHHILSTSPGGPFTIIWKHTVQAALQELRTNRSVDLVILDNYLPETGGIELLQHMRDEHIVTPVMLLTSQREFQLAIEALRFGVEDYLLKDDAAGPVLPRTILNVLERTRLKRKIAEQHRDDLFAQKRTDAIRELVVTICHEFNNPLAAIKISTDIVLRQWLSETERSQMLDLDTNITKVEEQIQRLRDINFE